MSQDTMPLLQSRLVGFATVSVSLTKGIISSSKNASISLDYHNYDVAICTE